jgi:hypothetical protein
LFFENFRVLQCLSVSVIGVIDRVKSRALGFRFHRTDTSLLITLGFAVECGGLPNLHFGIPGTKCVSQPLLQFCDQWKILRGHRFADPLGTIFSRTSLTSVQSREASVPDIGAGANFGAGGARFLGGKQSRLGTHLQPKLGPM